MDSSRFVSSFQFIPCFHIRYIGIFGSLFFFFFENISKYPAFCEGTGIAADDYCTLKPTTDDDSDGLHQGLQLYAYYYPWYIRDDWSRHEYHTTPLLGLYGTDEVAVAEKHIEWALDTGISSWVSIQTDKEYFDFVFCQ